MESLLSLNDVLLLDMASPHWSDTSVCPESGTTIINFDFVSSQNTSQWGPKAASVEEQLFLVEMYHNGDNDKANNKDETVADAAETSPSSWIARLGTAGQLYSLYGAFGEAIAPQLTNDSLWIDEVFQPVGVLDQKQRWFLHGAGAYSRDKGNNNDKDGRNNNNNNTIDMEDHPFWSPNLGHWCGRDTCIVASWAQQAHVPVSYKSGLINYLVYKNCGNGVIEHVNIMHLFTDYGDVKNNKITYINTPWVGLRQTTFREAIAAPLVDGGLEDYRTMPFPPANFGDGKVLMMEQSMGYFSFAQDLPLPQGGEIVDLPCYRWRRTCSTQCFCNCQTQTDEIIETCHSTCQTYRGMECDDNDCHSQQDNMTCSVGEETCPIRCMTTCTDPIFEFKHECSQRSTGDDVQDDNDSPPYIPFRLVIQEDNAVHYDLKQNFASLHTHDGMEMPSEDDYPSFALHAPGRACPRRVGHTRCLYLCGFRFSNAKTGEFIVVHHLLNYAFRQTGRTNFRVDLEKYPPDYINSIFRKGDKITVTRNDCGFDKDENLSLTFIHGAYHGLSWVRWGIGHHNVNVYTAVDNNNDIFPYQTYVNRNHMIVGKLSAVDNDAPQWVQHNKREMIERNGHPSGRKLVICSHLSNDAVRTFDVMFSQDIETEPTCANNFDPICEGSSTPDFGLTAYFYIQCGDDNDQDYPKRTYIGPDPYHFTEKGGEYLRPYLCKPSSPSSKVQRRPTWRLMGYFPEESGACSVAQNAVFNEGAANPSLLPIPEDTPAPSPMPSASPTTTPPHSFPPVSVVTFFPEGFCFSANMNVTVKGKGQIPISALSVGDQVLTTTHHRDINSIQTSKVFTHVYGFAHIDHDQKATFLQFLPSGLEISPNHLVFVRGRHNYPIPAKTVVVGDVLVSPGTQEESIVKSIRSVVVKGVYAPLTAAGTLLVQDRLVSNYVALQDSTPFLQLGHSLSNIIVTPLTFHWLSHAFQFPHRVWCHWLSGMRNNKHGDTVMPSGLSAWTETPYRFALRWMSCSPLVMGLLLIPMLIVLCIFFILENVLNFVVIVFRVVFGMQ